MKVSIVRIVGLLAAVLAGPIMCQMTRQPEHRARQRHHDVRKTMREWAPRLTSSKQASGAYPSPLAFTTSVKPTPSFIDELGSLPAPGATDEFNSGGPLGYSTDADRWVLISPGPDAAYNLPPKLFLSGKLTATELADFTYDPTNGTFSPGDIYRASEASKP